MQTALAAIQAPAVSDPRPEKLEKVFAQLPTSEAQPRLTEKKSKARQKPDKQVGPEPDPFAKLAATFRSPINPFLDEQVSTFCGNVDDLIQQRGLDAVSEGVIGVVQGTLAKLLVQLAVRMDVEQKREPTDGFKHPIAMRIREEYLPLLEKLIGLYTRIEKDRSSAAHTRQLGDHRPKLPATTPSSARPGTDHADATIT
jgi:hypothetical protein